MAVTIVLARAWGAGSDPVPGKDLDDGTGNHLVKPDAAPEELDLGKLEHPGFAPLVNWPPADPNPPIDVLHYELDLDFLLTPGTIAGTAGITLLWGSDPNNVLDLHLVGITPSAVRSGTGSALPYAVDATGLHITLPAMPAPGDTVRVAVDYSKSYTSFGPGFYVTSTAAYTFTEPEDARRWFPCHDVPWDKATSRLIGKCPSGWILVSNGALQSTVAEPGGTVYTWNETHPIATYLIAAAMYTYVVHTTPSSVTPLSWYSYPNHSTASLNAFLNLDDMMDFYDSTLVPYPFDKYSMVESNLGGGMEHQTCTLMGEFIFNDAARTWEYITAHELAHQWFGDLVTTKDWRHIWLNEGFASFFEIAWQENQYGAAKFTSRMAEIEQSVINFQGANFTGADHTVVDPPTQPVDRTFSTIIYNKGAWVLRMLRDIVGKPVFDTAITNYLNAHAFGNATTEEFISAVETAYGQDLDWFFTPWLYGTGRAELSFVPIYTQFPSGWVVQVDVRQVQPNTIFRIPLEIRVTTTGGNVLVTRWVEDAHEVLSIPVASQPTAVTLDPSNKILGKVLSGSTVGVADERPVTPALSAWPNPFSGRLHLAGSPEGPPLRDVRVFDVRGREVRALGSLTVPGQEVVWDGDTASGEPVPPGIYFVRAGNLDRAVRVVALGR